MNSKNILIALGVLGIGIILYKLLLGFVLPIALFVSLGYVLKFLLKGSETDSETELSQMFKDSEPASSINKIVEIQAIQEDKTPTADNSIEEGKTSTGDKSIEEDRTNEVDEPIN